MIPLHLGQLHPFEQALVLVLAFGPFALAGLVVVVIRRRDAAAEESAERTASGPSQQDQSPR
jgi:hypothetical protein